jgi:hypothetical protein
MQIMGKIILESIPTPSTFIKEIKAIKNPQCLNCGFLPNYIDN